MDIEPDAVPEAVPEGLTVARGGDDVPRDGVQFLTRHARADGVDGCQEGLVRDLVDLTHLARPLAERERAGHVAPVPTDRRAPIDEQRLALGELRLARHGVRQRAVGLGGHDRAERGLLGATRFHLVFELRTHFEFGLSGRDGLERRDKGILLDLDRLADRLHLVVGLVQTQFADEIGGRLQALGAAPTERLDQGITLRERHVLALQADGLKPQFVEVLSGRTSD